MEFNLLNSKDTVKSAHPLHQLLPFAQIMFIYIYCVQIGRDWRQQFHTTTTTRGADNCVNAPNNHIWWHTYKTVTHTHIAIIHQQHSRPALNWLLARIRSMAIPSSTFYVSRALTAIMRARELWCSLCAARRLPASSVGMMDDVMRARAERLVYYLSANVQRRDDEPPAHIWK